MRHLNLQEVTQIGGGVFDTEASDTPFLAYSPFEIFSRPRHIGFQFSPFWSPQTVPNDVFEPREMPDPVEAGVEAQ